MNAELEPYAQYCVTLTERRSPEWNAAKERLRVVTKRIRRRAALFSKRSKQSILKSGRGGNPGRNDLEVCPFMGCNAVQYAKYMEDQFRDGMTWDNFAKVWEVDHIKPLSKFDLTDDAQFRECVHYLNTRPLLKHENRPQHIVPPGFITTPIQVMKNGKLQWQIDLRCVGLGRRFSTDLSSLVEKSRRDTLTLGQKNFGR